MPKPRPFSDPAIDALLDKLPKNALWVADEHPITAQQLNDLASSKGAFISNRFDQCQAANRAGIASTLADMNLAGSKTVCQNVVFRVAKERAVVHRVINQAHETLPVGGSLFLSGFKNEGIKTHIRQAEKRFDAPSQIWRQKNQLLIAEIKKITDNPRPIDDDQYERLRKIDADGFVFWTKPGLYGWNKVDTASQFMADYLDANRALVADKRLLDLGCGYGYLSMRAALLEPSEIVATDNCAAALVACEQNLVRADTRHQVVASDAGEGIKGTYSCILCNPPFHRGFSTTSNLHEKFLQQTAKLLTADGTAWFVVNQFLNIATVAENFGLEAFEVDRTDSFKIIRLQRGRRN